MYTLKSVQDCLQKYADTIDQIGETAKSEDEYNIGLKTAQDVMKSEMMQIRMANPALFHVNLDEITAEQTKDFINSVKERAGKNFDIPIIPTGYVLRDKIGDTWIETPGFIDFQNHKCVLNNNGDGVNQLNNLLLSIILSFPIKKVKLTFVDFDNSLNYDFFLHNISPILYYGNPITTSQGLHGLIERLQKRTLNLIKEYQDYSNYVKQNEAMPVPFEFVILLSWSKHGSENDQVLALMDLCDKSSKLGLFMIELRKEIPLPLSLTAKQTENYSLIKWGQDNQAFTPFVHYNRVILPQSNKDNQNAGHFIATMSVNNKKPLFLSKQDSSALINKSVALINNKGIAVDDLCSFSIGKKKTLKCKFDSIIEICQYREEIEKIVGKINMSLSYENKVDSHKIIHYNPLMSNPILLKACVDYINLEAEKKEEARIVTQDIDSLGITPYKSLGDAIELPVGVSGKREINFRMDLVSHVHSFIIGQSGSGKSVFLHNVIGSAIMKYAPEDLELYLLDFKLGGVEFNRYQGVKHVKAMLVDNSDQQITLEILRELRERMAERGKLLRNAGASNLAEYNKVHPDSKLPHVLLVADECHEMFKQDSSIPRNISNAISDIVIKIAKEGRSQGVHLILATQTLSGTEISNEILNNVSDHYLLKCAAVDSERMVSGSADITSELTTGQIYYHHVEEQSRFQAFFTSKEDAAKLIDLVKKKAASHHSNGEFYFNGAQLFHLQNDVFGDNVTKIAKAPVAYVGKTIDINQCDLGITLRKDFSENLLLIGLNDSEQLTRTTMNAMISLMAAAKRAGKDMNFKVFNCLQNEDSIYAALLDKLESKGYCELIDGRKERAAVLKNLVDDIQNETAKDTMLFILGQDKFRELKMDAELESAKTESSMSISDDFFSTSSSSSSKAKTFKQAMDIILDKGPEFGVHVIMQLEKPTNFLFDDYVSPKRVFLKFKHLVMLRSDESVAASLHLNDTIRLETLSSDEERLRAYYYAEESDTYTMFTPYVTMDVNEIEKFIENK